MSRSGATCGPSTDRFASERFLDGSDLQWPFPGKCGYVAVSWGRRVCSGQELAEQGVWTTVTCLLWAFAIYKAHDTGGNEISISAPLPSPMGSTCSAIQGCLSTNLAPTTSYNTTYKVHRECGTHRDFAQEVIRCVCFYRCGGALLKRHWYGRGITCCMLRSTDMTEVDSWEAPPSHSVP